MDDNTWENYNYPASFTGECTCQHDQDEHSWGLCGMDLDLLGTPCPCEAGWEE